MVNSRAKGCRGELEWSAFLREHLACPDARRGQQFSGSPDSPDVVGGIQGLHPEVKRVERLNLQDAMEQAVRDCGDDIPYVASRRSRKPWLVTVRADDLEAFCRAVVEHIDEISQGDDNDSTGEEQDACQESSQAEGHLRQCKRMADW